MLSRRRLLQATALAATGTVGAAPATRAAATPTRRRRPNIVLILADDLGYGTLGAYGQKFVKTPHLDRLAAEGIRFTQGYSGAAVCAPSRTSLLTGMDGGHARVRSNSMRETGVQPRFLPEDPTLGKVLKAAGYRTGAFGKWGFGDDSYFTPSPIGVTCDVTLPVTPGGGLQGGAPHNGGGAFATADRGDSSHPLQQGFDEFVGIVTTEAAFQYWPDYLWHGNRRITLAGNAGESRGTYAPQVYKEATLDFIDRHAREEFFVYFAPQLAHWPTQVPDTKAYDDQVTWTEDMKRYASQITLLDTYVGQIVARLQQHGIADETLLVFTADNGPTPNEHALVGSGACTDSDTPSPDSALADVLWNTNGGLRAGKHSLYEGGIRVPLIAWGPKVVRKHAQAVADRPWSAVDLLPTLADIAGITAPPDVDGISVRDWITGEKRASQRPHPALYWERPKAQDQNVDGGPPSALVYTTAMRSVKWKAVRHAPGDDPATPDTRAKFELYDLESDPAETRDVSLLHPDIAADLQRQMRQRHAPMPFKRKPYRPRRTGGELRLQGSR